MLVAGLLQAVDGGPAVRRRRGPPDRRRPCWRRCSSWWAVARCVCALPAHPLTADLDRSNCRFQVEWSFVATVFLTHRGAVGLRIRQKLSSLGPGLMKPAVFAIGACACTPAVTGLFWVENRIPQPTESPSIPTMKFLLAVDGSRYTRRMLTYIVSNELLFRPHYEYVLFHVPPKADKGLDTAASATVLDESSLFLETQGFTPLRMLRQGTPAAELVRAANQLQSNMIVMGCRGLSALETAVMGSVTTEVLASSHVPVLVIR